MTKGKLKEELDLLGVEYPEDASKKDLEVLYNESAPLEEEVEEEIEEDEKPKEEEPKEEEKKEEKDEWAGKKLGSYKIKRVSDCEVQGRKMKLVYRSNGTTTKVSLDFLEKNAK